MDDFGAVALASGPAEPKVGEPGEKWSRKATLVERVKEVRDKVGQNDSHGQRGQRCRELGVVAHEREGDRPENTHNAGRSKTNLEFPRGVELLCTYPGSWAGSFRGLITPLLYLEWTIASCERNCQAVHRVPTETHSTRIAPRHNARIWMDDFPALMLGCSCKALKTVLVYTVWRGGVMKRV